MLKPERQILKSPNTTIQPNHQNKPRLGQGRAGSRRKMKVPIQVQMQMLPRNISQIKEQTEGIQTPLTKQTTDRLIAQRPETCIIPKHTIRPKVTETHIYIYPDPLIKPPPRLPDLEMQYDRKIDLDLDLESNKDFEENSPYQECIISEIYQRPDKSQLLEPPEVADLINTNNVVQKYLAKQTDIDKILKIIQRKVLKGTHLPVTIKEIQVGYLNSPCFKDLNL